MLRASWPVPEHVRCAVPRRASNPARRHCGGCALQGRWPLFDELQALDPEVYRSLVQASTLCW